MTANAMQGDREMCLEAGHGRLPQQADPRGRARPGAGTLPAGQPEAELNQQSQGAKLWQTQTSSTGRALPWANLPPLPPHIVGRPFGMDEEGRPILEVKGPGICSTI